MSFHVIPVPCLTDNYAYLLHDDLSRETALIDAPEAGPIMAELESRGWELTDIFLTHHHDDHVAGVEDLRRRYKPRVIGAAKDRHRLPTLDLAVSASDVEDTCGEDVHVLDVPGHTTGHVAFWLPGQQYLFSADSLMACGCGRLFEGDAAMMWASLKPLRDLPRETIVCSGHEYTETNTRFALGIEPGNADLKSRAEAVKSARAEGRATVPTSLAEEIATNPFLRVDRPELRAAMGMEGASDVEVFAEIRSRRDSFR
ncbi:hydroxyacylglutathione hydrolase [Wenxinia saemankumensis]|uniref:Hydroxyacylglutathione hydrolase n=1 Tax=Wenxinia saemankumensis TaxID=1447782 RepID=A0A1M6BU88_9RHOB|nr:hydroxyacylglutathione hydrolase [Wenxinia saemankumensis]SHI52251.1 hydroxyacylglutathione hydrolase [Wenxinia saemankumensis]